MANLRRKIMSLLLVVSMLTGLVPLVSIAEDEERKVYYSETFDSYDEGATSLSGLNVVAGTNKYEVRKKYSASSEKNFWYEFDSNQVYIQHNFDTEISGKVVFSFDVKLDNTTMGTTQAYLSTDVGTIYLARFIKGVLYLGRNAFSNYIPDKEYTITVALDTDADTVSYWIRGKLKQYKLDLGVDLGSISYIRLHTSYLDMETPGGGTFDDIYVYEGEVHVDMDKEDTGSQQTPSSGASPSELASQVMKGSVAFKRDWNYARVGEDKTLIDTDTSVVPFDENGIMHLPLRFLAENNGGSVDYDAESQCVTLTTAAGSFLLKGTNIVKDGKTIAENVVKNRGGRTFIPIDSVKTVFGVESFYDAVNGIAIVGDAPSKLTWEENKKAISIILSGFMYADLSGEEIIAKIKTNYPNKAHPRALVDGKTFEELKALIASDNFAGDMWSSLLSKADEYLTLPVTVYNIYDGTRLTSLCQQVQRRVKTLALAYNLTGDEKYAERAWMELYMASMFPDWNPNHYLDPAEMVAGFAIGYDWLYHWLDQTKRDIIIKAIEEYSFKTVLQDYNNEPRKRTWDWLRGAAAPNNWNIICNGATL
ncbi:MAG: stalk domain-containing protein, partial [Clostridia bacterium]|nr:stalk domain-containing protein [Clostridia bacterium]